MAIDPPNMSSARFFHRRGVSHGGGGAMLQKELRLNTWACWFSMASSYAIQAEVATSKGWGGCKSFQMYPCLSLTPPPEGLYTTPHLQAEPVECGLKSGVGRRAAPGGVERVQHPAAGTPHGYPGGALGPGDQIPHPHIPGPSGPGEVAGVGGCQGRRDGLELRGDVMARAAAA